MRREPFTGRWPSQGATMTDLEGTLSDALKKNIHWGGDKKGRDRVLGFPTMSPHPDGLRQFCRFQRRHTNAILCHTRGEGEKGFDGIKMLEKDVILMLASLFSPKDMDTNGAFDGYITAGGTEANFMGVVIGREYLRNISGESGKNTAIAVLSTTSSHYSLPKSCFMADIGEGTFPKECPTCFDSLDNVFLRHCHKPAGSMSGLHYVRSNELGQMESLALEEKICDLYRLGQRRFLIFLNEGTTMTGAMDRTFEIGQLLDRLQQQLPGMLHYIHVDAAYGGMVYPFIDPDGQWAFRVPQVKSLTVDPYKMGRAPLAQGVFICRKDLQRYIERSTGYVDSGHDDTFSGSRSGANAAAIWTIIKREGFEGFKQLHLANVQKAEKFCALLEPIDSIRVLKPQLNMVSFVLPDGLSLVTNRRLLDELITPFRVMWNWCSVDFSDSEAHFHRVVKFNMTIDTREKWFEVFADKLEGILKNR